MPSVDVHQHLWPEAVVRTLERRREAPRARWQRDRWTVDLAGEPSFEIDPRDHDPVLRARRLARRSGTGRAVVAGGVEALPARDALAALAAWQEAATELPDALGWWAATPARFRSTSRPSSRARRSPPGAAGLCLPADRLASPSQAEATVELLAAVADAGAPVFVHPGRVAGSPAEPAWWSPATRYVAQQQAAWLAFHDCVRPRLPVLRAIFALLAGLAPLQVERAARRGHDRGDAALADPLTSTTPRPTDRGPSARWRRPSASRSSSTAPTIRSARSTADPVQEAFGAGFAELVRTSAADRALGYAWVPA